MPFFSRVFGKNKDAASSNSAKAKSQPHRNGAPTPAPPPKPPVEDPWELKEVSCEEVQDLLHYASLEMKSRGRIAPGIYQRWNPRLT